MAKGNNRKQISVPAMIAVMAVCVVAAIAAALSFQKAPEGAGMDVTARSDGAGTLPQGPADEFREGLMNETSTDDFIDQSAASDLTPPLVESTSNEPAAETDAAELDPSNKATQVIPDAG